MIYGGSWQGSDPDNGEPSREHAEPLWVPGSDSGSLASGNKTLQDLSYTYDPVGNITEIRDAAQQEVFFDGDEVQPKMAYAYDALYRLTSATGREHGSTGAYVQPDENDAPIKSLPHANDAQPSVPTSAETTFLSKSV